MDNYLREATMQRFVEKASQIVKEREAILKAVGEICSKESIPVLTQTLLNHYAARLANIACAMSAIMAEPEFQNQVSLSKNPISHDLLVAFGWVESQAFRGSTIREYQLIRQKDGVDVEFVLRLGKDFSPDQTLKLTTNGTSFVQGFNTISIEGLMGLVAALS